MEGRWTPEDLLLGAIAGCYTTTFRALADRCKLEYVDLQVEVEGSVTKAESGYRFDEVVIRPNLTISASEEQLRATNLLQKAKTACLVSHALSVAQRFEARVDTQESTLARVSPKE